MAVETRLIQRIAPGDGSDAWWRGSFAWFDAEGNPLDDPKLVDGDANLTIDVAAINPYSLPYIVPAQQRCNACHDGSDHRVLGFQAIQLTGTTPINTDTLWAAGHLTHEPASGGYPVPGANTPAQAALGYLHGNCSHCHGPPDLRAVPNVCFDGTGDDETPNMEFRVRTTDTTVQESAAYRSAVNHGIKLSRTGVPAVRIVPGDPGESAVYIRMSTRGTGVQMPPLGSGFTRVPDPAGTAAVQSWIDSIAAE